MGMSDLYGSADDAESIATIHAALDAGVSLLDTGDYYAMGENEMLIRRALQGRDRDAAVISVKFGVLRDPAGGWTGVDGRPEAVKNFLAYTLRRLGTDHVDIYRLGRFNPAVPIEETVGAIGEMVEAGYVRHVGLSEVGAETIRRANATHSISDLQIEYSLLSRGIEAEILPTCRAARHRHHRLRRALARAAQRPLESPTVRPVPPTSAATLPASAARTSSATSSSSMRSGRSRRARAATVAQVAIAWVLSRGDRIVPLVGARTRERLSESLGALELTLSDDDLHEIERALPAGAAAGERYDDQQMAILDSERS